MYLKSLTLKGFKSFADRTVMRFEPGVAAVVGPNGSGKSNISDAVLWVLGERNAKNLRGQSMEDVIFAGSSARKPVSVAEVELLLDNTDGTLPVDFAEVSIGRRMYRSGESEYLINGNVVRRMDVLDILHDSVRVPIPLSPKAIWTLFFHPAQKIVVLSSKKLLAF